MDSGSIQFVLFGIAAALVSNFSTSRWWRTGVLLAASLVFFWIVAPNPMSMFPFAAFLAMGYFCAALAERGWRWSAPCAVILIVFSYMWLKKYTLLPSAIFLRNSYFTLGLSYVFFRVLHLVLEARERGRERSLRPVHYLLYAINFTTLICGPIQRYEDFSRDQFATKPIPLTPQVIGAQFERIVIGSFKVNVLATFLDMWRRQSLDSLTSSTDSMSQMYAAANLFVLYPFFLYCNFSGYIDIVIAIARLMRFRLPENFDRPFSASSFLDFWNRWHITLSTWLKTYVYNPLLMMLMRRFEAPAIQSSLGVLSFFVTFFLIGIWHGRTSEYAFFGLLQGGGVAINKIWQLFLSGRMGRKRYRALCENQVYIAFGRGLTFSWFAFTLLWFWADWSQISGCFRSIHVLQWVEVWGAIWILASVILSAWNWVRGAALSVTAGGSPILHSRYFRVAWVSALTCVIVFVTLILSQPAPGIVYKTF